MGRARLSDAVTARALALALRPGFDTERAATILAAEGTPHAIRHALARVKRALKERPSRVGLDAAHALEGALTIAAHAAASVPMPRPRSEAAIAVSGCHHGRGAVHLCE